MQIEIEKQYNKLWPPKYDLKCLGSECPVGCEIYFGQEFYVAQIDCQLVLCPLCRFKEISCTVPNCKEKLEKHQLKTTFNVQSKKLFTELDKEVQEELEIRKEIYRKYDTQIKDLKQSTQANQHSDYLAELLEDAIYFTKIQNRQQQVEIDKKIILLWRSIEFEDLSTIERKLPQKKEVLLKQQVSNENYASFAGFNERQFHLNRILAGFL